MDNINSYEKTIACLFPKKPKLKVFAYYFSQFFVTIFNYATILINGTNFSRFLFEFIADKNDNRFINSFEFFKLITILTMILLMIVIKSSEFLKIPSLISTLIIVLSLIIFWFKNSIEFKFQNIQNMIPYNFAQALPLISSQIYSIESVGTLLTIRQAMNNPGEINEVIKKVFIISLFLFIINGISFNTSFLEAKEVAFDYYNGGSLLVGILKFGFYLTLPATMIITVFAIFAVFESIECLKNKFGVENDPIESQNRDLLEYNIDDDTNDQNNKKGNLIK